MAKPWTIHEVCDYARVDRRFVYAEIHAGRLRASKVTGRWLTTKEWVDQWLFGNSTKPAVPAKVTIKQPKGRRKVLMP